MPPARKKSADKKSTPKKVDPVETRTRPATRISEQAVLDEQRARRDADREKHNVRRAQFGE